MSSEKKRNKSPELSLTPSTPYVRQSVISPPKTRSPLIKESAFDPSLVEGNERPQDVEERKEYAALFSTLLESNALLLEEIRSLQQNHQTTLSTAQDLQNESQRSEVGVDRLSQSLPPKLLQNTWVEDDTGDPHPLSHSTHSQVIHSQGGTSHTQHTDLDSDGDERSDWTEVIENIEPTRVISTYSDSSDSQTESPNDDDQSLLSTEESIETHSSIQSSGEQQQNEDPFSSPGSLAIEGMWDDFSVEEYAPYQVIDGTTKKTKQWTPKITVPEPFSMTVRESQTPKRKSRSLMIAEREKLEKTAQEEAELMKKFRATPVPASTFLPIYELVNAKNQQRREEIKMLSKHILKSNEKPFNFVKREQKMKQMKIEHATQLQQIENEQLRKSAFKAKPVPKHLFDPSVDEQILEQEEYRKIRIQMRSEELLAKSKLPGDMHLRSGQHPIRTKDEANEFVADGHMFHPDINGSIPDYDRAYYEFQKKLAAKKKSKRTTTSEPFYLHTQRIPSRKQQVIEDIQRDSSILPENRWPFVAPRAKVSCKSPKHTRSKTVSSVSYPAQMTETARLRQSLTQEKLNDVLEKEISEETQRSVQKERERAVRKTVLQKSISHDPTSWLEERKRQKLREFQ